MRKSASKVTISIIIMTALLSTQIILPLQASAENKYLNWDNPNKDGSSPFKLNLTNVTPQLLTSVVSCTNLQNKIATQLLVVKDTVKKELDKLFKKAKDELLKGIEDEAVRVSKEQMLVGTRKLLISSTNAGAIPASTLVAGSGVPGSTYGILAPILDTPYPTTAKTEDKDVEKKLTKAETEALKKEQRDIQRQNTEKCINGIAIRLAKNQLTSMTKYTMNWVNSGFNGDPLFVRNVDSLMYSIENKILEEELSWFKKADSQNDYPFGRDYARSAISAKQMKDNFLNSMKSDLDDYLIPGGTTESFSNDFSEGGWSGWFAMTQRSQNNPLGFMIESAQNLAEKQGDAVMDTTNELNRGGGVLDQKKCAEYAKPNPDDDISFYQNADGSLKCLRFETVTPGSVIKTKVDTYVNTPERQLELVRTMDDALNALFAAFLKMFQNQGLSSLGSQVNDYAGTATAGFGVNQVIDSNGNTILVANTGTGSGTGVGDGNFDLTKDLGNTYLNGRVVKRGVIQTEYDYLKSAKESMTLLGKVVPAVGKLDQCIPGPNPNWLSNAQESIDDYISQIDDGTPRPIDLSTLSTTLTEYENGVNAVYGPASPMQTSANSSYLRMSGAGLAITKDLVSTAETVADAKDEYQNSITEANANMAKLLVIKDKVNTIITAAQRRRTTERASAGLPAIKASCLATEKVTYLDNGVMK